MKALVWHGERDVRLEEADAPQPEGGDEIVLDVELSGICGSDLHGYRGHPGPRVPPLVLGHEVVGSFEGERFTVYPLIGCGTCAHCRAGEDNLCSAWRLIGMQRPGVFAEQVAVPRRSLVPVPSDVASERAVLTEPLACAVGALAPYALGAYTRVVVIGCGPIGLLSLAVAARRGAEVIAVDPLPERRAIATRLGATEAHPDASTLGASADLVVDAAGFAATWRIALETVRNGGDVAALGLGDAEATFPMAVLVRRSVRWRGQFAYSRADFAAALELLSGDLELGVDTGWLVTVPLTDGRDAFEHLVVDPAHYVKVLLST